MTEEDEEFQRLEREAKMRALEDDDIQDYVRPWVGLTDKEVVSIEECALTKRIAIVMTAATLKAKNT